jgi:hypothetical protein
MRQTEDPLTDGHIGKDVVDQMRRPLRHPPAAAPWTKPAALAGEGDEAVQSAGHAAKAGKAACQYLFSGLTKCAECGGGYVMYWRDRLACFGARSRGTCTNRLTISRQEVEERVLVALRDKLMRRDLFEDFCLDAPEMPELLHPRMADVYREKVGSLCVALESEESRTGATKAIRALVDAIVLEPDGERLKITLKGDLAGMLSAARDSKRSPDTGDLLVQIKLVAGRAAGASCNYRSDQERFSPDRS